MTHTPEALVDLPPLSQRRPGWMVATIAENEAYYSRKKLYGNVGSKRQYKWLTLSDADSPLPSKEQRSSEELIARLEDTHGTRDLKILDLGCGQAAFVRAQLEQGRKAQGVSLADYRKVPDLKAQLSSLTDEQYIVGDTHHLTKLEAIQPPYHLVCSRYLFTHMFDPLGGLEDAANLVAPGGILAVDQLSPFDAKELTNYMTNDLADDLARGGFVPMFCSPEAYMYQNRDITVDYFSGGVFYRQHADQPVRFQAEIRGLNPEPWGYVKI